MGVSVTESETATLSGSKPTMVGEGSREVGGRTRRPRRYKDRKKSQNGCACLHTYFPNSFFLSAEGLYCSAVAFHNSGLQNGRGEGTAHCDEAFTAKTSATKKSRAKETCTKWGRQDAWASPGPPTTATVLRRCLQRFEVGWCQTGVAVGLVEVRGVQVKDRRWPGSVEHGDAGLRSRNEATWAEVGGDRKERRCPRGVGEACRVNDTGPAPHRSSAMMRDSRRNGPITQQWQVVQAGARFSLARVHVDARKQDSRHPC